MADALGRFLAAPVTAVDDVPGFDNSAMDGYAVRAADTAGAAEASPRELAHRQRVAGRPPRRPRAWPGEAIAISTGAMVPAGADAVVRVEDTSRDGDRVSIKAEVEEGRSIRRAGEDIRSRGDRDQRPAPGSERPSSAPSRRSESPRRPAPGVLESRSCSPATSWSSRARRSARARSATPTPTRSRRWRSPPAPSSRRSRSRGDDRAATVAALARVPRGRRHGDLRRRLRRRARPRPPGA